MAFVSYIGTECWANMQMSKDVITWKHSAEIQMEEGSVKSFVILYYYIYPSCKFNFSLILSVFILISGRITIAYRIKECLLACNFALPKSGWNSIGVKSHIIINLDTTTVIFQIYTLVALHRSGNHISPWKSFTKQNLLCLVI